MKNIIKTFLAFLVLCPFVQIKAQDDLLSSLDNMTDQEPIYTAYTFKSSRIINGHSVEVMRKNQMDFRINHRFGEINSGVYDLFGLDNALINFSLEHGLTDRLNIGIRRGTYQKIYDGSIKYLVARQCTGIRTFPVTISYFSDLSINTLKITEKSLDKFNNRLAYTHQLLIARKFDDKLSLQLSPSFVHRNQVNFDEENDVYAMGIGGRYKFVRRIALTAEYFYASNTAGSKTVFNPVALGFDIETGGHVFQLFVTNSRPMVEKGVITETTGNIKDGGLYFGFNISRVFSFGKSE